MRRLMSAAMIWRASRRSMERNPSEKPRTPERAPTPAATPRMTKANLTADARVSRQAMRPAVNQKLGMGTVFMMPEANGGFSPDALRNGFDLDRRLRGTS